MSAELKSELERIALTLAPALKDKFDLSVDKDFDDWADMAFKAAAAFYKKTEAWTVLVENTAKEVIRVREAEALKAQLEAKK